MQSRARGGDDLRTNTSDALYNDVDYTEPRDDPDFGLRAPWPRAVPSELMSFIRLNACAIITSAYDAFLRVATALSAPASRRARGGSRRVRCFQRFVVALMSFTLIAMVVAVSAMIASVLSVLVACAASTVAIAGAGATAGLVWMLVGTLRAMCDSAITAHLRVFVFQPVDSTGIVAAAAPSAALQRPAPSPPPSPPFDPQRLGGGAYPKPGGRPPKGANGKECAWDSAVGYYRETDGSRYEKHTAAERKRRLRAKQTEDVKQQSRAADAASHSKRRANQSESAKQHARAVNAANMRRRRDTVGKSAVYKALQMSAPAATEQLRFDMYRSVGSGVMRANSRRLRTLPEGSADYAECAKDVAQDIANLCHVDIEDWARMMIDFVEREERAAELHVCGACGVRDPEIRYSELKKLKGLPIDHWLRVDRVPLSRLQATAPFSLLKRGRDGTFNQLDANGEDNETSVLIHRLELHEITVIDGLGFHVAPDAVVHDDGEPCIRVCCGATGRGGCNKCWSKKRGDPILPRLRVARLLRRWRGIAYAVGAFVVLLRRHRQLHATDDPLEMSDGGDVPGSPDGAQASSDPANAPIFDASANERGSSYYQHDDLYWQVCTPSAQSMQPLCFLDALFSACVCAGCSGRVVRALQGLWQALAAQRARC